MAWKTRTHDDDNDGGDEMNIFYAQERRTNNCQRQMIKEENAYQMRTKNRFLTFAGAYIVQLGSVLRFR